MQIQIDTREKQRAIKNIISYFDKRNIGHFSSKLYVGDYMSLDNPRLIIDRKQNLLELTQNVCQGYTRFTNELKKAKDMDIKLVILCQHGKGIETLEDVKKWENPRLETSPYVLSGGGLHKRLCMLSEKYGVEFEFCRPLETGKRIVEILGEMKR